MPDTVVQERSRIEDRIVRYADLEPCYDAFIDTRTPGSDKKENFTIIGPGVSENPNQHVHIAEPHGFNIGGARQPPRCTNSQHSHQTVEVFYVHTGQWRFDLGEHADDAQICLGPGDLISIPTNVFRGFTNTGESDGFLWAVLGGDDPGHVLWAPKVFDMARDYGLLLLEDGMLIDINKGEKVPAGKAVMPVTTEAQVAALDVFSNAQLEACVIRSGASVNFGPFNTIKGVRETELIGPKPIDWSHGFTLNEIEIEASATIPSHRMQVADVYFVQTGKIIVSIDDEKTILTAGDTITFPVGTRRSFTNANDVAARIVAVRGGDKNPEIEWI
ncbi:MAG: cupin domain-containing protein [Henriciella sp.]|nr:cupin domain-containing protein [Henriciella sp.]MBO6695691.1 cupin domain-containing protein [Henriciella sp.]